MEVSELDTCLWDEALVWKCGHLDSSVELGTLSEYQGIIL